MGVKVPAPRPDITVRIDRLVVETEHPVDAFALQRALSAALLTVVSERGVPAAWSRDRRTTAAVVDGFAWDGHGAEHGLAAALAVSLYEVACRGEVITRTGVASRAGVVSRARVASSAGAPADPSAPGSPP